MDYAVDHVNEDHRKEMVLLVQQFTELKGISDVTLLNYDSEGMELIVVQREKPDLKIRVDFPITLNSPQDFRAVLVEMVKTARKKTTK